jgi:uncharacterized MAPEG superfamily protein
MMEVYAHAIVSLALWPILQIVLSMMSTIGLNADNRCDCGLPKRDYADVAYRRHRAFGNAIEMSGPFIAATLAAILAGAAPFWVNLLASVFLVSRVVTAAVHIGTENQPARSVTWMVGLICVIALAVMAVVAVV